MPKDQVPVLTLSPTEPPLTVARALGRPVAIVRMGVRKPTVEEIQAGPGGDVGLDWAASIGSGPCPFLTSGGTKCGLPCGPVCTAPAPAETAAAASRRIPLRRRRPRHRRGLGIDRQGERNRPSRHGRRLRHRPQGARRAASFADQRRLHLRPAFRRSTREQRPQPERRHPARHHQQAPQQVFTVEQPRRPQETGAKPVARAHQRAIAGVGRTRETVHRGKVEQPRAELPSAAMS